MLQASASKFFIVRCQKVVLDYDIAEFIGVKTKTVNQAVKRNPALFPESHMFRMNVEEMTAWRFCETATKPSSHKNKRPVAFRPYAFTQAGLAALLLVLFKARTRAKSVPILMQLPGFLFSRLRSGE